MTSKRALGFIFTFTFVPLWFTYFVTAKPFHPPYLALSITGIGAIIGLDLLIRNRR